MARLRPVRPLLRVFTDQILRRGLRQRHEDEAHRQPPGRDLNVARARRSRLAWVACSRRRGAVRLESAVGMACCGLRAAHVERRRPLAIRKSIRQKDMRIIGEAAPARPDAALRRLRPDLRCRHGAGLRQRRYRVHVRGASPPPAGLTTAARSIMSALNDPREGSMASVEINGKTRNVNVDPSTPLLWVIRDTLGMTGTKFGCGAQLCARVPCIWMASWCARGYAALRDRRRSPPSKDQRLGRRQKVQAAWAAPRRAAMRATPTGQIMAAAAAGSQPQAERCRHRRRHGGATSAAAARNRASARPSIKPPREPDHDQAQQSARRKFLKSGAAVGGVSRHWRFAARLPP